MAGTYSHTTRASGTVLTASIYNTDHQNHIDNADFSGLGDYSASVAEMQTQTDPGEDGSESQATDGKGEIERLRHAIAEARSETYWYATQSTGLKDNFIVNGQFEVAQRGTSYTSATTTVNNDDTWLLDCWLLLSDGNDIVDVTRETSVVPTGAPAAIKLDVETANKKFGICQIIENAEAKKLAGRTVSLTFKARITGSTIGAIRAGVASWTSTADSVTSDLVSVWGAAGTNPTLATNWAFDNTPAALTAPTTSYQTYKIEGISVSSSATNVAVFIWTDDVTMDVADILYIGDVQLTLGTAADVFRPRSFSEQVARCRRFFERIGRPSNCIGHSGRLSLGTAQAITTSDVRLNLDYDTKRASPTVTVGSGAMSLLNSAGTGGDHSGFTATSPETSSCIIATARTGSGLTAGHAVAVEFQSGGNSYIDVTADL